MQPTLSEYNPYENVSRATRYIEVENERMMQARREHEYDRMRWILSDLRSEHQELKRRIALLEAVPEKKRKKPEREEKPWVLSSGFWEIFKRPSFR